MRKFVRDPNVNVNQEGVGSSSERKTGSEGNHGYGTGSVGRNMADSYAKRTMFYIGVEDQQHLNGVNGAAGYNNAHQSTQQMMMMLENQSPKQVRGTDSSDGELLR